MVLVIAFVIFMLLRIYTPRLALVRPPQESDSLFRFGLLMRVRSIEPMSAVLRPAQVGGPAACRLGLVARIVALLTAATLFPVASRADCATEAPAAARQFWEGHSHFYERTDPTLREVITPRFYAALEREWSCIKTAGCAAYEPWPHPGDAGIAGHPTFYISLDQPDHVLVSMNYALRATYGRGGPQQFVIMTLTQRPDGRCWLLDDLVTSQQGSFRERFHPPGS